jgi:peptidoglycan/LPS O-acetylase OafA/YrhL
MALASAFVDCPPSINITFMNSIFVNYESSKLVIASPSLQNLVILLLFGLFAVLLTERKHTQFLDRSETDQLKGAAILLAVTGHLWWHVSLHKAMPILGDYGVSLFLVLSGFGLTLSYSGKCFDLKEFCIRRAARIFVPYWMVTLAILFIDWYLLKKLYTPIQIVGTLAGINVGQSLGSMDYTRWYISLLFAFYLIFAVVHRFANGIRATICIVLAGTVLATLRVFKTWPLGMAEQILAFPLGCMLGQFHGYLGTYLCGKTLRKYLALIIIAVSMIAVLAIALKRGNADASGPSALVIFLKMNSILFCSALILGIHYFGNRRYASSFLVLCGSYSYEIYLLHGPLLIKYDPILRLLPTSMIALSFMIFLAVIAGLAYGLNRAAGWCTSMLSWR